MADSDCVCVCVCGSHSEKNLEHKPAAAPKNCGEFSVQVLNSSEVGFMFKTLLYKETGRINSGYNKKN